MSNLQEKKGKFGVTPVFLTALSTILGAVMFLRFGYAVGNVGFIGTVGIILLGHLITIPTAMAIAEIATNQKVEGGGEYYIISRSFGINIGAAIGLTLYLSQAISIAFYSIAFSEAFDGVIEWLNDTYHIFIWDKRLISAPLVLMLSAIMLSKGAQLGVKILYPVVAILVVSLLFLFLGDTGYMTGNGNFYFFKTIQNPDSFFIVFAIIFPAFTGMTAGVGLSGDLKDPKKAIPLGSLMATVTGMLIYLFIAYKLTISASPEDLVSDQLIMGKIALWGPIIALGLAAATFSSALGSIMVAPRTLQALASDKIIPNRGINAFLSKETKKGEPFNATVITILIALFFLMVGDINMVAQIISMFFMVTYGAICSISFLQHFAADPSYRPAFKSRWYVSLLGAVLCFYMMFKMNAMYALSALLIMVLIYVGITYFSPNKQGMVKIFQGVIYQLSRQLQVFLQKADKEDINTWRPSLICISDDSFKRTAAFELMRWISHRYGFGTYLHYIKGYVSRETNKNAHEMLARLIEKAEISKSNMYLDTIISPSYTTAIAQSIQLPSVSGKESNMFMFEYSKTLGPCTDLIMDNMPLVSATDFDICVLASTEKGFGYHNEIHIWITQGDFDNASLMILMSFVIMGHRDWQGAEIKIFAIHPKDELTNQREKLLDQIKEGRLPISPNNVELIEKDQETNSRVIINKRSVGADLTIIGFNSEAVKQLRAEVFEGYHDLGNILFVNSSKEKELL
jgi:solute carrier family 12 (sodium/potassium/chloride transporter), member 2